MIKVYPLKKYCLSELIAHMLKECSSWLFLVKQHKAESFTCAYRDKEIKVETFIFCYKI